MNILPSSKIRKIPRDIQVSQELIQDALDLGCSKAKLIKIKSIVLGHWIRIQCQYGCDFFGKRLTCPPFTPLVDEVADLLAEYQDAILIEVGNVYQVLGVVIELENNLKEKGFAKAFGLGSQACGLCDPCSVDGSCEHPQKARPTMRAFGIDVPTTITNNGWILESPQDFCSQNPIGLILIQ